MPPEKIYFSLRIALKNDFSISLQPCSQFKLQMGRSMRVPVTNKGTHRPIDYFSSSLYAINQKPMIPRIHFYCITTWVARSSGAKIGNAFAYFVVSVY